MPLDPPVMTATLPSSFPIIAPFVMSGRVRDRRTDTPRRMTHEFDFHRTEFQACVVRPVKSGTLVTDVGEAHRTHDFGIYYWSGEKDHENNERKDRQADRLR